MRLELKEIIQNLRRKGLFLIPLFIIFVAIFCTFLYKVIITSEQIENYSLSAQEIASTKGNLSILDTSGLIAQDDDAYINGQIRFNFRPRVTKTDLKVEVSVKGENIFILPNYINDKDMIKGSEQTIDLRNFNFNGSSYYKTLNVKNNSDLIYYNIDLNLDKAQTIAQTSKLQNILSRIGLVSIETVQAETTLPSIILRHGPIRIIEHQDSIEMRFTRFEDEYINNYSLVGTIDRSNLKNLQILAIYKKPTDIDGFIEFYINGYSSGRRIISKLESDEIAQFDTKVEFNEIATQDVYQSSLTIGQEELMPEIETLKKGRFLDSSEMKMLYEKAFKDPIDHINRDFLVQNIPNEYLKSKTSDPYILKQEYYDKEFYNYFQGEIISVRTGYEYPIHEKEARSLYFYRTPFDIFIYGNDGKIDRLDIKISENK